MTNKELRDKALAEKDISPEQFEQLQQLQRVKTKDEQGNVIEEKQVYLILIVCNIVNMYDRRITIRILLIFAIEGSSV